jgi:hypothetical protein
MLIFRKTNPEAEKYFFSSCFPLAKYLDFFYDVPENSEHINTFRGAWLKKSPFQIQKFNFLEQKKANAQNEKVSILFHNYKRNLSPKKSQGKR